MKAVNLIPTDERARSSAGGAGLGSYVLIAVLAVVVIVGAAYTLVNRSVSDRRDELARVQAQVKAANDQAQALQAYSTFSNLSKQRKETVRSLAASRFDWSHALHEVARTVPSNAWLISLRATVTPAATTDGGVSDPLRSAVQAPAIEIVGCTTSQDNVAKVIASLRRADGVQRVSLSSSERLATASTGSTGSSAGGSSGDCRNGNTKFPQFSMTLFFKTPTATGKTP
jgi:Tfp pilus assembly protein PilN